MSIISVKNISYYYEKTDSENLAIRDISFDVEKGDFIAILGKSGSGKSTLVNHLNGLNKAKSGTVYFEGKDIYSRNYDIQKLRFNVGLVFQYPEYQLFSETVIDDVMFGALKKGLSKDAANEKAIELLKSFNIEHLKDESPFSLSGGEKRKVAFAGILVMEPKVLILDEPDAGLDPISKRKLFDYLIKLNKENDITIMFITHNLDDAIEYSNKTIVLREGKLLAFGDTFKVLTDENVLADSGLTTPHAVEIYNVLSKLGKNIDKTKLRFDDLVNELK